MWRKAVAALIIVAAGAALYRLAWIPYQCNLVLGRVSRSTAEVWEASDSYARRQVALRNLELLAPCLESRGDDVGLLMLAASNSTMAERHHAAQARLTEALKYDRRPELHMALGLSQLKTGERDRAVEHFVIAGKFFGRHVLASVPDTDARWAAYRQVGVRLERLLSARGRLAAGDTLVNGTFSSGTAPWTTFNGANIKPVPSSRRAGGTMLHVVTESRGAGIRQIWPTDNTKPRVLTTVWVFVKRGTVSIGSGSGGSPLGNARTVSLNQWERVEAISETCPVRMTAIFADAENGAEFYVDEVSARETFLGPPCERWM